MSEPILTSLQTIIDQQHQTFDNKELQQQLKEILLQLDPGEDTTLFVPPTSQDTFHIGQYTQQVVVRATGRKGKNSAYLPTGFRELDKMMGGGFENGELIILGGRPVMGKTTLMLAIIRHLLAKKKIPVYCLSTYDEAHKLISRLHAMTMGTNNASLAAGTGEAEWDNYIDSLRNLEKLPLYLDDTRPAYIERILDASRWMKTQHGIRFISIWDLQSIRTERHFRTRDLELGYICRRLRELSRELNLPILAISQLNRTVEYRSGTRRPQLADLRDSGNIELEADKVLLLYRPEYYTIDVDEMGNSTKYIAELNIARNQTGKTGSIYLKRDPEFTRYSDFDGYTKDLNISGSRMKDLDENDTPF